MYELAEYMPNSVLEDAINGAEYITEKEFQHLHGIYIKCDKEILDFLKIIYECRTCEIYSRLCECSPDTLVKVNDAVDILRKNNIELVNTNPFEKYLFDEYDGWGICFEGKQLSVII